MHTLVSQHIQYLYQIWKNLTPYSEMWLILHGTCHENNYYFTHSWSTSICTSSEPSETVDDWGISVDDEFSVERDDVSTFCDGVDVAVAFDVEAEDDDEL